MRSLVLPLAALLSLAGCLGPEAPPDDAGPTCADASLCGRDPATPEVAPAVAPAAANATREVSVPFAYEGSTGAVLCPPIPARAFAHCVTLQPARGEAPEMSVPTPRRLVATLTSETGPADAPFYVSLVVDVGEGWTWDPDREPGAEGSAPLEVDWDLSSYPADAKFLFYVEAGRPVGPTAAGVDQDYAVEGVLSGLAPA